MKVGVHRFRVHTIQGYLYFVLTSLVGQQALDETTTGSAGPSGMITRILKLSFRYVLLIQCLLHSYPTNQQFRPVRRMAGGFSRLILNPEPLNP